jgi:hypothetical protein
MKRLFLLVAALLVAAPAAAQQPADTARTHVVRAGDTLWDLASQYLANPFRWSEIYGVNRDVVADPHWIYPAERLRIPGASAAVGAAVAVAPAPADGYVPPAAAAEPDRTVFFPASSAYRSAQLITAADAQNVTVVTEGDYYRAGRLVPQAEMRPVGTLVEVAEASAIEFRASRQIHPHTRVYMKLAPGAPAGVRVGDEFHLWRDGREVRPYGRIFHSTGVARVVAVDGDVATVEIERLFAPVQLGDKALPVEQFPVPGGVIPRPASGAQGRVITLEAPQTLVGLEDVVFVDLGSESGVVEGDELAVVIPPQRAGYGVRPEIQVARLQVVRVSGRTSAARVVHLEQPALEVGQVVRLVGKMP